MYIFIYVWMELIYEVVVYLDVRVKRIYFFTVF